MGKKQCGIYEIVFPNGKRYIGQSCDIQRRIYEHKRSSNLEEYCCKDKRDSYLPVHKAMKKYEGQYQISILEECSKEELNEKERYWIDLLHSSIDENGYNIGTGGQESFALKREHHSQAKLTEQEVQEIKEIIEKRETTFRQIAKLYNVSPSTITMINKGQIWRDDNREYPICKNATNDKIARIASKKKRIFSESEIKNIRYLYDNKIMKPLEIYEIYKDRCSFANINAIIYRKSYTDVK